jgi:GT2 family glycosyltransferase
MGDPRLSVITAVDDPPRDAFDESVASVLGQTSDGWEWILVDASRTDETRARVAELAAADDRIRVVAAGPRDIVAALDASLRSARGEFVAFLGDQDTLDPTACAVALQIVDDAATESRAIDFCYADHDFIGDDGRHVRAYEKPDWSPERLRHHMYTARFAIYRRQLVLAVGGIRAGFDSAWEHDLVLRVTEKARQVIHVPQVLYHWRRADDSAADNPDHRRDSVDAAVRAVSEHLDRVGISGHASPGPLPFLIDVDRVPDITTPVSIVIPTIGSEAVVRGKPRILVTETVRSVLQATKHQALEFVIVYDTPTPSAVLDELRALGDAFEATIKLIEFREPFNFATKCNTGVFHASGEILVFLNDDMEAAGDGVVERLIAPLSEPDVGVTGAKLIFENGQIQHAGINFGGGLGHVYYLSAPDDLGSRGELVIDRECSAVTGACLAVRRRHFDAVGGFNEALPGNFNDVDFCLKVRMVGLRVVWLHDVTLYHFESLTREPAEQPFEAGLIRERWGDYIFLPERYSNVLRFGPKPGT